MVTAAHSMVQPTQWCSLGPLNGAADVWRRAHVATRPLHAAASFPWSRLLSIEPTPLHEAESSPWSRVEQHRAKSSPLNRTRPLRAAESCCTHEDVSVIHAGCSHVAVMLQSCCSHVAVMLHERGRLSDTREVAGVQVMLHSHVARPRTPQWRAGQDLSMVHVRLVTRRSWDTYCISPLACSPPPPRAVSIIFDHCPSPAIYVVNSSLCERFVASVGEWVYDLWVLCLSLIVESCRGSKGVVPLVS